MIENKFIDEEGRRGSTNINSERDLNFNSTVKKNEEPEPEEDETRCGIGCFSPQWLQILASKKSFVIIYALAGMQQMILYSYQKGTLTTNEKNFNMTSKMFGVISAAWDIGFLISNITVTYIAAKGNRTRWVAGGMFLLGISSFMRSAPYLIFGPGETIKMYTKEYGYLEDTSNSSIENTIDIRKMSTNVNCKKTNTSTNSDMITYYIFIASSVVRGMGTAVYWTCGATYLDDNVRKNIVPTLLAIVQAIRLFGPTIGLLAASYALKFFVDPYLTPVINNTDPRWIGAWWIGYYPIGVVCWIMAVLLMLFPKTLPRAALRRRNTTTSDVPKRASFKDFKESMGRILRNRVMMFNTFASVFFTLGFMGYWTFMPKYLESQFRLTASQSNFISGTVGIFSNGLGIVTAGLVISKFKPAPRFLAGWNVFVEFLDVAGHAIYPWLSCPPPQYHGHWNSDHSWNLTETCNIMHGCGTDIQYAPVCDLKRELTYYSSCHAGCTKSSFSNGTKIFMNCSCVPDMGSVVDGLCPSDCSKYVFLICLVIGILSFTSASGRSANTLIQFRCVDEADKSLSIGFLEAVVSLFALMPAPILYAVIVDWSCMVWGDNCGTRGNCWIYEAKRLDVFNFTASSFLLVGTILDVFVWYHVKGIKIYDEDFDKKTNGLQSKNVDTNNTTSSIKSDVELPLISSSIVVDNS